MERKDKIFILNLLEDIAYGSDSDHKLVDIDNRLQRAIALLDNDLDDEPSNDWRQLELDFEGDADE